MFAFGLFHLDQPGSKQFLKYFTTSKDRNREQHESLMLCTLCTPPQNSWWKTLLMCTLCTPLQNSCWNTFLLCTLCTPARNSFWYTPIIGPARPIPNRLWHRCSAYPFSANPSTRPCHCFSAHERSRRVDNFGTVGFLILTTLPSYRVRK